MCVNDCPAEMPYFEFDGNKKHCYSECPENVQYHNSDNSCTQTCEKAFDKDTKLCMGECTNLHVALKDPDVLQCMEECPDEKPYINGNECIDICPAKAYVISYKNGQPRKIC